MSELTKLITIMMKSGFTIKIQPLNYKMLSLSVYHIPTNTEAYSQISFESLQLAKTDIIKEELEKIYKLSKVRKVYMKNRCIITKTTDNCIDLGV